MLHYTSFKQIVQCAVLCHTVLPPVGLRSLSTSACFVARDGVENWELTEMKQIRKESPVMEQLWTDAIVELESELGRDWQGLMHHHSMSDPTYTPRS